MSLPSYEEAINTPNIPTLIADHLDGACLALGCLVSKSWHLALHKTLWSDPIRILSQKSRAFVRTVEFFTKLQDIKAERCQYTVNMVTRLDFRPLLHLSTAPAFLREYATYEHILTTQFVSQYVSYLPNLRFVALEGLRRGDQRYPFWKPHDESQGPASILLLDLSGIRNIDTHGVGIENAFRSLLYLDLSFISVAPSFSRQYTSNLFSDLRVVKLRGLQLTDNAIPGAVISTGGRLWSLDIRDNNLTDLTLDRILHFCCQSTGVQSPTTTSQDTRVGGIEMIEDVPGYLQMPPNEHDDLHDNVVPIRPDDERGFTRYLQRNGLLTQRSRPVLDPRDDMLHNTGITHLYVSGNSNITATGIRRLLNGTNRIQVLDIGSGKTSLKEPGMSYTTTLWQTDSINPLTYSSGTRLEKLRIHHSIVTYCPTVLSTSSRLYALPHLYKAETVHGIAQKTSWSALLPSNNHRLRHLTLTDIPTKSYGLILTQLKAFLVDAAAQENALAAMPKHRRAPKTLSGLRVLRLEFVNEAQDTDVGFSVSEDIDADEFHAQSQSDFSFFEDERPQLPVKRDSKIDSPAEKEIILDVREELKKFRASTTPRWGGRLELVSSPGS